MASSATVGSAVVKLSFDGKGVKSELDDVSKEAESKMSGIGSKIGSAMKVTGAAIAAGIGTASAAVVGFAKNSVQSFDYTTILIYRGL